MVIEQEVTVELAAVEVNDDYRIELRQIRKVLDYSPEQAEQLGTELLNAAARARGFIQDDMVALSTRMRDAQPRAIDGSVVY